MAEETIAASWAVTSDSLAAWLARRLGARRLVLVKSAAAPSAAAPAELAARGLVDAAFPDYAAGLVLVCCGPGEEGRLAQALQLG
jgi:5-(aminomethyl)-3-furanmethanol phosphate kinase